ncbi:MAG: GAF domain-containing protein [Blastocatellia bacterium]|nr:GAF domain-containing protein [Blastocatellia bacterium]
MPKQVQTTETEVSASETHHVSEFSGEMLTTPALLAAALEREKAARKQLDALVKISSAVNSSRDLNGIFGVITEEVRKVISFDRASIALLNEDRTLVQVYALHNDDSSALQVGTSMPAAGTVTERVVKTGQPIICSDLQQEARFVTYPNMLAQGFRSSAAYPLRVRGQMLGTLNFTSRTVNCYSPTDLDMIERLSDPIAIAVDNLQLLSLAEKRAQEAQEVAAREETINRIVSAIRRTLDLEDILRTAAEQLGRHTATDRCLVYVLDETEATGTVRASCYVADSASPNGATWVTIRDSIAEDLRKGNSVAIPDASSAEAPTAFNILHRLFHIGALLYVPIIAQDALVAVIELNQNLPRAWTVGEISLVTAVAAHISVSLHQAQLHHEVIRQSAENAHLVNELRETNQKLGQVNQMKDEFLANLSHELRTPLTAITAWAELLNVTKPDSTPNLAEWQEGISTILSSSTALTQIIEDLIDLSHIQNETLNLDLIPVNLHATIEEAVQMVRQQAREKGVHLEFQPAAEMRMVKLDTLRMRQVLWNLLTNGIKFTPPGGRVTVSTELQAGHLTLKVKDTGIGIEPSFLPHVFDRFRQEDATRKRKYRGLGIGLTIVKALVEAHHGTIKVTSNGRNQGTTVTLTLPVSVPVEKSLVSPLTAPSNLETPATVQQEILVIEDDPVVLRLIGKMVEHLGYTARLVESATLALKLMTNWQPALILTDINMPGMDGLELLEHIRQDPTRTALPVVALTGFVSVESLAQLEDRTFNDVLTKPVSKAHLADMLRKHLAS